MSIGQITLDPILVDVPTTLNGLKGLKGLTTIRNVDVQGGTQEGINLGINGSYPLHSALFLYADSLFSLNI